MAVGAEPGSAEAGCIWWPCRLLYATACPKTVESKTTVGPKQKAPEEECLHPTRAALSQRLSKANVKISQLPQLLKLRVRWGICFVLFPAFWGRLQSMGSLELDTTERLHFHFSLFTFMHWRRKWQPTPVFWAGESQGWGSLVGCRLWGHTESDTTEAT